MGGAKEMAQHMGSLVEQTGLSRIHVKGWRRLYVLPGTPALWGVETESHWGFLATSLAPI